MVLPLEPLAPVPPSRTEPESKIAGIDWQVPIQAEDPSTIMPRHLHAVVSVAVEQASLGPGGDQAPMKHRSSDKPYAISPLWQGDDGQARFTLSTLGSGVRPPSGLQPAQLGRQQAVIQWGDAAIARVVSWPELASLDPVQSVLVRFETPMTRRRGGLYLAAPNEISLLESWERAAAKVGLEQPVDWRSTAARFTSLSGHTVEWSPPQRARGRRHRPIGFIGEVELEVPPAHGQRLHQLAVLATFAGSGAHTTYGMGFTTLVATTPLTHGPG